MHAAGTAHAHHLETRRMIQCRGLSSKAIAEADCASVQHMQAIMKHLLPHLAIVLLQSLEAALGQVKVVCRDDWVDVWELMLQMQAAFQCLHLREQHGKAVPSSIGPHVDSALPYGCLAAKIGRQLVRPSKRMPYRIHQGH